MSPGHAPELVLTIQETGAGTPYELTGDQVAALVAVPHLVRLSPAPGGRWAVRGNQKVGTVRLRTRSGGSVHLRLRPKIGIRDLLFLLSYAPADPWRPEQVTAATADDLLPTLADLLARTARRTLEAGVLHGYREVEEELPLIRGSIRTTAQLRRTGLPLPVAVRYDDHTPDIPENRVLLAALHLAAYLPGVPRPTCLALRHLADRLHGVHRPRPGEPLPTWTPSRLNARYAQALRLAELLLSGSSIRQEGGTPIPADGFLLDLPQVFERFVTVALGESLARHGIRGAPRTATDWTRHTGSASARTWSCTARAARSRRWTRSTRSSGARHHPWSTSTNSWPTAPPWASPTATSSTRRPRRARPPPTT